MKKIPTALTAFLLLAGSLVQTGYGRQAAPGQQAEQAEPASGVRELLALTYPEGRTIRVQLQATQRLPGARGEAKVQRKRGTTELEVELRDMKPALLFGGDYNTFILWTVSPEGIAHNSGEFVLRGNRSKLRATTPLSTFGILVSAEPHFLVSAPSPFVVLENTGSVRGSVDQLRAVRMTYRGYEGDYNFQRETLADQAEVSGEFRADRQQAMTAVALAERALAERYAPQELTRARHALRKTIEAIGSQSPEQVSVLAHEAVRMAVEAQQLAENRAREAVLEAERRDREKQVASLEETAREAKTQAEQLARAKAEAEEAAARARQEAEEARRAKAAAEEAAERARWQRQQAEEMMKRAQAEADRLVQLKAESDTTAQLAIQEREQVRARLQEALSRFVETKKTARGLIINLPDILFDSGQAALRGPAREVLSRVAGILSVMPDYRISVEGHTDSVGNRQFNQRLSEKRAESVYNYLKEAGVSTELMTMKGFGESQPLATNDTQQGRQKNRRVEIVIQELGLDPAEPETN